MILRHGRVVAEGWWAPYRPDDVHLLYSVSKSVTATALGFALAEGRFALDDPWSSTSRASTRDTRPPGPRHHGRSPGPDGDRAHERHPCDRSRAATLPSRCARSSSSTPETEPGSVFTYNNGATYTLAPSCRSGPGQTLTGYLRPRLFDPLGIAPPHWHSVRPRRARLLRAAPDHRGARPDRPALPPGGSWRVRQVLPAGWVSAATRSHTASPGAGPGLAAGYGYQFWRSRHGYRADGAFGQSAWCCRHRTRWSSRPAETERCRTSSIGLGPPDPGVRWAGRRGRRPAGGATSPLSALPVRAREPIPGDDWLAGYGLTEQLRRLGPDGDRFGRRMVVDCSDRRWLRTSVPVGGGLADDGRGSGRWTDPDDLAAELVFVHTPHR